jgi:hypothetical protein
MPQWVTARLKIGVASLLRITYVAKWYSHYCARRPPPRGFFHVRAASLIAPPIGIAARRHGFA